MSVDVGRTLRPSVYLSVFHGFSGNLRDSQLRTIGLRLELVTFRNERVKVTVRIVVKFKIRE